MNKLFIVLLALCLVTVHAFVKRDAPAPSNDNTAADFKKSVQDLYNQFANKLSESFSADEIKKNINAIVDGVQTSINNLKPNSESKQ